MSDLPEAYLTAADETIEITENNGIYTVDCWNKTSDNIWSLRFDKLNEAIAEFERWKFLQVRS